MITVPKHPDYSKNSAKPSEHYPCVVCGKPASNPRYMVHLHNGGSTIVTEDEAEQLDPAGDMSLYPLGSDCLKKHPELKPYAQDQRVKLDWKALYADLYRQTCGDERAPESAVMDDARRRQEVLNSYKNEPEDIEDVMERQRLHWEDRRAIERDYTQLY